MLEEPRMDKKSLNRSTSQQSRAVASDCKKSTELTHNKPWPRINKKREGTTSVSKNEPYRKNVPQQRGRGQMDKRPRARDTTNFSMGGAPDTGLEDEPEIGSVFTPGSKKQNLNHLLNFMYPSRSNAERRGHTPRRQTQHWVSYKNEHDLYLRAYCQFVVKEDGDYKVNLMDPDLPLKWEQIEEIIVRSPGKSECPICLGTPVAGRVGHCGHVYCWACILHYSAANEKQPPPCPVCAMSLQVIDMKPTRMVQWGPPTEQVTMRLVRRLRGSTVVEVAPPRSQLNHVETTILPLDAVDISPYAKLFSATKQQVMDILERDRNQIKTQILAEFDTSEIVYLEQALDILRLKEEKLKVQYDKPKAVHEETEGNAPTIFENKEADKVKCDWFDVTEDGATCLESVETKMESLNLAVESNLNPEARAFKYESDENKIDEFIENPTEQNVLSEETVFAEIDKQNQTKYFYFYQAEDGQQVFLNSLNVRILNASWGALAAAPSIICGRVLQRETFSLNEQTRKHSPYTAHLPLHCSFDIVELDLKPPYVTDEALRNFAAELYRRVQHRAKHERDERRRERAYRRQMEGPPKPDFSSELLFPPAPPVYSNTPLVETSLLSIETASSSVISTSGTDVATATHAASPPGLSFAKMASASGTWRVRKSTAALEPPPSNEEDTSAPRFLVLSDAIEVALLANSPTIQPSGKKNKKKKQKLLFTTEMHRSA